MALSMVFQLRHLLNPSPTMQISRMARLEQLTRYYHHYYYYYYYYYYH